MIENIGTIVDIAVKYDLTFNQIGFLSLVWVSKEDKGAKHLYKYCHEKQVKHKSKEKPFKPEEIEDLMEKGIIIAPRSEGLYYDEITFSDWFADECFCSLLQSGNELWDSFPGFMSGSIEGRRLPAKNISKFYSSMEELFLEYCEMIGWSKVEHKNVLRSLEIAKQQNEINYSIVEWVKSKKWKDYNVTEPKSKERLV